MIVCTRCSEVSPNIVHRSSYSRRKSSIDSPYWLLKRGALLDRELGIATGPRLRLPITGRGTPEWREPRWDWIEAAADRWGDEGVQGHDVGGQLWNKWREWGDGDLKGVTKSILLEGKPPAWLCIGITIDCWLEAGVARDDTTGSKDVNEGRPDKGWTLDDVEWLETWLVDKELDSTGGSLVAWPDWSLECKLQDIRWNQGR